MKLKALTAALFFAGLVASFALSSAGATGTASTGTTTGSTTTGTTATSTTPTNTTTSGEHHHEKGDACEHRSVVLKGTLVSVGASSFVMGVEHSNHHGHALVGSQATVAVDAQTKFRRHGPASLADLKPGDRLSVKARAACAAPAAAGATGVPAQLTARKVDAHPAQAAQGSDEHGKDKHKEKGEKNEHGSEHGHSTTTGTTTTTSGH